VDPTSFLILVTGIFGFYMAWNIGANDVANAMGTSVGSKALTYWRAIFVAAIFEFLGCYLVGGQVASTIQGKILDVSFFQGREIDLALGMLSALLASGIFLNFATWRGWPVSTTHAIIGALAGFGVIIGGVHIVKWATLGRIVLSWVISPIAGGIMAWLVFLLILRGIIRRKDPQAAMVQIVPFLVFMYFFVVMSAVLFKGLSVIGFHPTTFQSYAIATSTGLLGAVVSFFLVRRVVKKHRGGHSRRRIERVFSTLQVMTACYMAFAHGANDVGNAIAPLSAVIVTLKDGIDGLGQQVSPWILGLGAAGIITGLATFGYRVMATIGGSITGVKPTRGFAAEFGAATVVLIASKMGIPMSTSHTIVGAVIAIGFLRGIHAVNTKMVKEVFTGWLITVPVSAIIAAILYWIFKWIWLLAT
jgi:inorganic phosphate transporter, PiT family